MGRSLMVMSTSTLPQEWEFLMRKPRRCAIYRRISEPDTQSKGTSLSDQYDECMKGIVRDGGIVSPDHVFTDGMSGAGLYWREREGIQELLRCAKRHEYDYLYIDCLDRFGRDYVIQQFLIEELRYYGVTVISMKKEEPTDKQDIASQMALFFWGKMAEQERLKIIHRTQRGIKGRVTKKGALLVGSRPLYGYRWADKEMMWDGELITVPKAVYVVYEPEAKYVRAMMHWARLGESERSIAKALTDKKVPSPNGKAVWRPTTVHNILTNEAYTGIGYAFKRKFTRVPEKGMHREIKPREEWIQLDSDCIPQIIDPDTFQKLQDALERNKVNSPRNNPDAQDTLCRAGLAICGYCHSTLTVERNLKRGSISYHCYKRKQGYGECKGCYARAHFVDEIAMRKAIEVIRRPSEIEEELESRKIEDPTKGSLQAAETVLKTTIDSIIQWTHTFETTKEQRMREFAEARISELLEQKEAQEQQYDKLLRFRINWEDATRALDEFKAWCIAQRPIMDNPDYNPTYKEKRDTLEMIGIRVIVYQKGHKPSRFQTEVNPPDIMEKFGVVPRGRKRRIAPKSASAF